MERNFETANLNLSQSDHDACSDPCGKSLLGTGRHSSTFSLCRVEHFFWHHGAGPVRWVVREESTDYGYLGDRLCTKNRCHDRHEALGGRIDEVTRQPLGLVLRIKGPQGFNW